MPTRLPDESKIKIESPDHNLLPLNRTNWTKIDQNMMLPDEDALLPL
jgi:hypothetical protein